MAPSTKYYSQFFRSAFNKEINLLSDSLKLMLVDNLYVFNQDTHRYKSDITHEVSASGYTAGGLAVSGVTYAYDAPSKTISYDATDVAWPSSSILAYGAVLFDSTPATDATRPLILFADFGGQVSTTSATFNAIWAVAGMLSVTVA